MSERVDFYILPDQQSEGRLQLACRLAEKAYNLGHCVYIHAPEQGQAQQLDDLLWTFKQNSFVPHALYPSASDESAPVRIGSGAAPGKDALDWRPEVLINLALEVPDCYKKFQRVIELVDQNATVLQASRRRFKHYREAGLEPDTHKL